MSGFRIFGILLALLGVVATIFPSWFSFFTQASEPTTDIYEAVERRVRGGMLLGLGLPFIAVTALRPWSTSIPTAIVYFVTGVLAARFVGLMIEGTVPKQWLLVAVEAAVLTAAALWLWRSGASGS